MRIDVIAKLFLVAAVLSLALLASRQRTFAQDDYQYSPDTSKYRIPATRARAIITGRATQALLAIKNFDLLKLSDMVHPRKGVRFSEYAWIDWDDKRLSRQQLRNLARRDRREVWFTADEAGTPMRMTTREYFRKHLYEHDYLKASRVTYNTQHKRSNTIPNVLDFFPRAIVVEYYEPDPVDPVNERGWPTLWLAFEKVGSQWYLVGVVKDSPTM